VTVQSDAVPVGGFVRIDGVCYEVTASEACDSDAGDELPDDLQFEDCDSCAGGCWTLTTCNTVGTAEPDTIDVRSPNLAVGDVIWYGSACWQVTAAIETCDGSETKIDATAGLMFDDCDECKIENEVCTTCKDSTKTQGTGNGADEAAALAAAKDAALDIAKTSAAKRGINVCACEQYGSINPNEGGTSFNATAFVCWTLCCPEGMKQIEYVTEVNCVDGEVKYKTHKVCVQDLDECKDNCD
jgi:hypothetical protein